MSTPLTGTRRIVIDPWDGPDDGGQLAQLIVDWDAGQDTVAAKRPQPVAWLARDMGANRQNVQRIVNDLHKEGWVAFESNPHHRRAQLVVLTDKGRRTFDAAMRLQAPWINGLSEGLPIKDVKAFHRVIMVLREKLESNVPIESA